LWVVVILLSIASFITLVLCVPLDLELRIEVYGKSKFTVRLIWLFGLVKKELRRGKKEREAKNRIEQARAILEILRIKGLLLQLKRLFGSVLRRIELKELKVDFRIGADNPADTALPKIRFLTGCNEMCQEMGCG